MLKLKVFRTPIGFHDAYVAAPSQKAALEAWGSDADLFARGIAERVEDPELMREPLEKPGTVIRRLRGTTAEQIAALPPDRPARRKSAPKDETAPASERRKAATRPKPRPRPSRSALDRAEQALADIEERHQHERQDLARRRADLDAEKRTLEKRQKAERAALDDKLGEARAVYEQAMRDWSG